MTCDAGQRGFFIPMVGSTSKAEQDGIVGYAVRGVFFSLGGSATGDLCSEKALVFSRVLTVPRFGVVCVGLVFIAERHRGKRVYVGHIIITSHDSFCLGGRCLVFLILKKYYV